MKFSSIHYIDHFDLRTYFLSCLLFFLLNHNMMYNNQNNLDCYEPIPSFRFQCTLTDEDTQCRNVLNKKMFFILNTLYIYIHIYIHAIMNTICPPPPVVTTMVLWQIDALGYMMSRTLCAVSKCMSCLKVIVVKTKRAYCVHYCIYITLILLQ